MAGDSNQAGGPAHAAPTQDGSSGGHSNGGTPPTGLPEWEAAVGRGALCLRATAKRYRMRARNPARAALQALSRHGLDGPRAREGGVWIAIYLLPDVGTPRTIYAVGGTHDAPTLQLRAADLLPPASALLGPGGPFDTAAIDAQVPRVARRRAQTMVGSSGVREVMHGAFWQREATLYSSTAMVLAAFGFPMSAEVFAVGGVLLLLQGAARLAVRESRIMVTKRKLLADPEMREPLRAQATRAVFVDSHTVPPQQQTGPRRRTILREEAAVPNLTGEARMSLLIDEDTPVTTGMPGGPPGLGIKMDAEGEPWVPASDNLLTVVFRRPRRPKMAAPAPVPDKMEPQGVQPPPAPGRNLPAVIPPPASEEAEEIEIIEAELLDPEAYYSDEPARGWWA